MSTDTQPQRGHSDAKTPITATGAQHMSNYTPETLTGTLTDARLDKLAEARALARLAPEWTDADADRYARLMWQLDGHGGALWYTWNAAEWCTRCAERVRIDSNTGARTIAAFDGAPGTLTLAQDAYLCGVDTTREHAASVCEHGGSVDTIPACDACHSLIENATLTPDGVIYERRAYVAVYALAERGKRAGHVPSCAQEDTQAIRRDTLAAHGVRMADLERAAMIADAVSLARERADGFR